MFEGNLFQGLRGMTEKALSPIWAGTRNEMKGGGWTNKALFLQPVDREGRESRMNICNEKYLEMKVGFNTILAKVM